MLRAVKPTLNSLVHSTQLTVPSSVDAANTVAENVHQSKSVTASVKSNLNSGEERFSSSQSFSIQSALHVANTRGWNGLQRIEYY